MIIKMLVKSLKAPDLLSGFLYPDPCVAIHIFVYSRVRGYERYPTNNHRDSPMNPACLHQYLEGMARLCVVAERRD